MLCFYRIVRNDEQAIRWHNIFTPWLEEAEVRELIKDYDYKEIEQVARERYSDEFSRLSALAVFGKEAL